MRVSNPISNSMAEGPRFIAPNYVFVAIEVVAIGLSFAPRTATQPARDAWREALRPGLAALGGTADWIGNRWAEFRCGDAKLPEAERKITALNDQVRLLQTQLLLAQSDRAPGRKSTTGEKLPSDASQPLLVSQTISARVLGRQAQMFLPPRELLNIGKAQGAKPRALVVDDSDEGNNVGASPLLDEGRDAAVQPGRLVVAGSRVWGKVAETGLHTSTVQRVTDVGYRDLVQLARERDGKLQFTGRGMLMGRGESLCKVEMVESNVAVTVGDLVFTADDGVLDAPLVYGRVARVARKSGGSQWEIWMEPAIDKQQTPSRVAVLKMELNPARFASNTAAQ
jgi:cell shape-determining protein MreC